LQAWQSVEPVAFFSNKHSQGFCGCEGVTAPPSALRVTRMAHSGTRPLCAYTHDYLWILSRDRTLPQTTLDGILARAKAQGFPVGILTYTEQ
jgi:hypothetical protein